MQKFILFACCFGLIFLSFSADNGSFSAKDIEKNFIAVHENLKIEKYEITNGQFKRFLLDLKARGQNELFERHYWDTAQWEGIGEPMKKFYHSHAGFEDYPAATVRYESALAYCEWLTEKYNSDPKRKLKNVRFRLPTEAEWTLAANGGDGSRIYPFGNTLRNKKGEYLANYDRIEDRLISYDASTKSYRIMKQPEERKTYYSTSHSFERSPEGFYNMSGNVAEMVMEKGIAKGGSFKDPGYDIRIASVEPYQQASIEIGFRVAMEIIEH